MSEGVVAEYLGLSASTLRKLDDFPTPVRITPGRQVWLREDVDRWLDRRAGRLAAEGDWLAAVEKSR